MKSAPTQFTKHDPIESLVIVKASTIRVSVNWPWDVLPLATRHEAGRQFGQRLRAPRRAHCWGVVSHALIFRALSVPSMTWLIRGARRA